MKKRSLIIFFILLMIFIFSYNNLDFTKLTDHFVFGKNGKITDYRCLDCNVIFIVLDSLRADHVGAYGYERNTTPNIDRLAAEGLLFKNMVAQSSWTKPSVASMFTGLYSKNHGATKAKFKLPEEMILLSEVLKESGYKTAAFSTNINIISRAGFDQGFDYFKYFPGTSNEGLKYARSDEMNEEIIDYLTSLKDNSQHFIYIHYMDPHTPYLPKKDHFSSSNHHSKEILGQVIKLSQNLEEKKELTPQIINLYDDEIRFNDASIAEIVETLEKKGMLDRSIIIIASDHGEEFLEHQRFGHGKTLYDELLLVPLIIRTPLGKHSEVKKLVEHVDIMPTILALLEIPAQNDFDGENIFNRKSDEPLSYAEFSDEEFDLISVRSLNDKLIKLVVTNDTGVESYFPYHRWDVKEGSEINHQSKVHVFYKPFFKIRYGFLTLDGQPNQMFALQPDVGGRIKFDLSTLNRSDFMEAAIITISPCKGLSGLGSTKHMECIDYDKYKDFFLTIRDETFPLYVYYWLKDDPRETEDRYLDPESQKKIKKLADKLSFYIKNKKHNLSAELAQYNQEQLEILKALGYI